MITLPELYSMLSKKELSRKTAAVKSFIWWKSGREPLTVNEKKSLTRGLMRFSSKQDLIDNINSYIDNKYITKEQVLFFW